MTNNKYDSDGLELPFLPVKYSWGLRPLGNLTMLTLYEVQEGKWVVSVQGVLLDQETLYEAAIRLGVPK